MSHVEYSLVDDERLVDLIKAALENPDSGEAAAFFRVLWDRHYLSLLNCAKRKLRDGPDLPEVSEEDIVQMVYEGLWKAIKTNRPIQKVQGFMLGTMDKAIRKSWESRYHQTQLRQKPELISLDESQEDLPEVKLVANPRPSRPDIINEGKELLGLVDKVPNPNWSAVLRIYFIEGQTVKEIAGEMNLTQDQVKGYLRRGLEWIKKNS